MGCGFKNILEKGFLILVMFFAYVKYDLLLIHEITNIYARAHGKSNIILKYCLQSNTDNIRIKSQFSGKFRWDHSLERPSSG
jgi:hypothetical protein